MDGESDAEELSPVVLPVADSGLVRANVRNANPSFNYLLSFAPWRLKVRKIVLSTMFDRCILLIIVLNCITLALYKPGDNNSVYKYYDWVFAVVFIIEAVLKMVGMGLIIPPWEGSPRSAVPAHTGGYFRDWWNTLDFIITCVTFAMVLRGGTSYGGLRSFRVLRILRVVSFSSSIRVLVSSLIASLPKLADVVILFFVYVGVCGIIGIQLWKGKLRMRCVDIEAENMLSSMNTTSYLELFNSLNKPMQDQLFPVDLRDTVCHGMRSMLGGYFCPWGTICVEMENPGRGYQSFDDIGSAMLSLFVTLSLDGWADLMYRTADATLFWSVLFYIQVISFGSFFIVNLTLVIISYAFDSQYQKEETLLQEARERKLLLRARTGDNVPAGYTKSWAARWRGLRITGTGKVVRQGMNCETLVDGMWEHCVAGKLLTDGRIEILTVKGYVLIKELKHVKPLIDSSWRLFVRRLVRKPAFGRAVSVIIILNTIILSVDHFGQPSAMSDTIETLNISFTLLFVAEMLLGMVAFGFIGYFQEGWNAFDAVVNVISILDLILGVAGHFSVLRSLRIIRVLKQNKRLLTLRRWVLVVIRSLRESALNCLLIMALIFSYAILGLQTMGGKFCNLDAPCVAPVGDECTCVPRANFDNIWSSMLTLFQVMCGTGWSDVMYNGMHSTAGFMALFFVSFYCISNYLFVNLFVALLLHQARKLEKDAEAAAEEEKEMGEIGDSREVPLLQGRCSSVTIPMDEKGGQLERAFFFLSGDAAPRKALQKVVEHIVFEVAVVLTIAGSTIAVAVEDPLSPPDSKLSKDLEITDYVFTSLFTLEAVMKIFTYGFVLHKTSYLRRDKGAWLDAIIVILSWASFVGGRELALFRVLRAIRPLRLVSQSDGMKLVLSSLVRSVPGVISVMFITFVIWGVWSIVGVQLFKGAFYSCTDVTYGDVAGDVYFIDDGAINKTYEMKYKSDCLAYPDAQYSWANAADNFDTLPEAFITLFKVASLEGWVPIMYMGIDAVSHDVSPQQDNRPFMSLYFMLFVLVGSIYITCLFVSVVLDTYYSEEHKVDGKMMFLNEGQKRWVQSYREMLRGVDRPSEFHYATSSNRAVQAARRITSHRVFEPVIQFCIVLNLIVMTTEHYDQSQAWVGLQDTANYIFIAIFTAEAAVKMVAQGVRQYFKQSWNRFDFFIVVLSWVGTIVLLIIEAGLGSSISVIRILRLARVLRLTKKAKGITMLLKTLFFALPAMLNVVAILVLVLTIYAAAGVHLFGRLSPGEAIGRNVNFHSFPHAIVTLLKIFTGDGWGGILSDCRRDNPACDDQLDGCTSSAVAVFFFLSFSLIGTYVLLNLFISIILDSFDDVLKELQYQGDITKADMKRFRTEWNKIDTERTFRMDVVVLPLLLKAIGPPLGVPEDTTYNEALNVVADLDLYATDERVDMQPLLQALFCRVHGSPDDLNLPEFLVNTVARKADMRFHANERDTLYEQKNAIVFPVHVVVGFIRLQAAARGMLTRQKIRRNYMRITNQVQRRFETISSYSSSRSSSVKSQPLVLPMLE
eukprot:TRINITY_DN21080_c0_g1_i1.p1 TRINITY_DN21080_c0_g1~~TRINITY_DN21080_c0_g1_i1.p1  ORF type:complete len:1544 (+),score=329.74 TRINITY_DN21080_c0_g1_i1:57-4688(+)